jgi:N-acetylneuraminic acid mutarotase
MTSVGLDLWLHGGTELWRFSTSTPGWERANSTAVNGGGPSARSGHVMTSVELDLWVHGGNTGSGEVDVCYSAELWRFSTSTRVWEAVDSTATNGAGPSARRGHVMTSVGLDLWLHGGDTETSEGDVCATHVALLLLSR